MKTRLIVAGAAAAAVVAAGVSAARAQQVGNPTRTVVQKHDLMASGEEGVMAVVDMPVGSREGRHTHPAEVFAYVIAGTVRLEKEGQPARTYEPGESFFVERGIVHEGMNGGKAPARLIAVFVTDKGKPMTTQVK